MRLLLVEDELKMADALIHILKANHYTADHVSDGESAFNYALSEVYDLIILDVMIPKMNGIEVLKRLREEGITTKVIILSAKGETEDRIKGLDLGADDYLAKPFYSEELLARIRALTRRKEEKIERRLLTYGDLTYDPQTLKLKTKDKNFRLTSKEGQMFAFLLNNQNQTISKDLFIEKLWSYDEDVNENTVEVYISFLRKKLQSLNSKVSIKTIRNLGYTLSEEE